MAPRSAGHGKEADPDLRRLFHVYFLVFLLFLMLSRCERDTKGAGLPL